MRPQSLKALSARPITPPSLTLVFCCAWLLLGSGCPTKPVLDASFAPKTTIQVSSSRCQDDGSCQCRPLDSYDNQTEQGIPEGHKRFEFRLPRSTAQIWVEVQGKGQFYKPPKRVAPACFYVDLVPGLHQITVHSEMTDPNVGLQTGLEVLEYGPKDGPHWYRSLDFVCGEKSTCSKETMKTWVGFQRKLPRGVLDPCGSTMIRGVTFGGRRPQRHLTLYHDLTLRFTMKVYEFETYREPGSPVCVAPVKNQQPEQ